MEKTNVPYAEWPEWIKLFSAAYVKSLIAKTPKVVRQISFFSFFVGALVLFQQYYYWNNGTEGYRRSHTAEVVFISIGVLNILLGFMNYFVSYKLYTWVYENSSWEERFAHKSSVKHKFQYFLILFGLIPISWLIAHLICC